jgi:hypothetical protein
MKEEEEVTIREASGQGEHGYFPAQALLGGKSSRTDKATAPHGMRSLHLSPLEDLLESPLEG